ncbi:hypothetical protein [Pseudoalteromonas sp. CH_XMU1449-3]|uniref:hypothetical protein n=1 Tax=Pseudoalteromonas sp. CH_XMU1449-3 TaxID=3107774 RepID=UPI0030080F3C
MNSLENYLLSLQINCYHTSVMQVSQVQMRIWQSLQNSSSYANSVIEEFELSGQPLSYQHAALFTLVLQQLGYKIKPTEENTLSVRHNHLLHDIRLVEQLNPNEA